MSSVCVRCDAPTDNTAYELPSPSPICHPCWDVLDAIPLNTPFLWGRFLAECGFTDTDPTPVVRSGEPIVFDAPTLMDALAALWAQALLEDADRWAA